jgi:hypothetical protein
MGGGTDTSKLRKMRRQKREQDQKFKRQQAQLEESGGLDVQVRYQGKMFVTRKFSESGNYQGEGLWTGFHRWVKSVTGIERDNQRLAQWDDWNSVTFSWMKEADMQMLTLGLEPYPWEQFVEEIAKTGETEFQAIEQRACAEEVVRAELPPEMASIVGATLVIRCHTIATALKMVSDKENAAQATARINKQ